MCNKFRLFFKHYSKLDLVNWLSILFLMLLFRVTSRYQIGQGFAWGLFLGSIFWLAILHHEIDSTTTIWEKKRLELDDHLFSVNFQNDLKKAELKMWSFWITLLLTDWLGLFTGIVALGTLYLVKSWTIPFFIISIAGIGATVVYFFIILYRSEKFGHGKAIFE